MKTQNFPIASVVDTHQSANSLLTTALGKIDALVMRQIHVLIQLAWKDIVGRRINAKAKLHQLFINLIVVDCRL